MGKQMFRFKTQQAKPEPLKAELIQEEPVDRNEETKETKPETQNASNPKVAAGPSSTVKTVEAIPVQQQIQPAGVMGLIWQLVAIMLWLPRNIYNSARFMLAGFIRFVCLVAAKGSVQGWDMLVKVCDKLAKVVAGIPVIGKFLSWLFGLPGKLSLPAWLKLLATPNNQQRIN
jgi:hypothetical protein